MIFGINTTSDISKLLYVISRAVRRVKFETILKYHEWYLCQISLQIMLLIVYTTTRKWFVIFTCRYFKLSSNTTALSQSNCRNFSCSSIMVDTGRVFRRELISFDWRAFTITSQEPELLWSYNVTVIYLVLYTRFISFSTLQKNYTNLAVIVIFI